jgi:hypothetical protein
MINTVARLYAHLIISLKTISRAGQWRGILHLHLFFLPVIPGLLLFLGAYRGFRTGRRAGTVMLFFEIAVFAGSIGGGILLFLNPHLPFIGVLFYISLCALLYRLGARAGYFLKLHKRDPLATYAIVIGIGAVLLFFLLSSNMPSMQFTKEGLKQTYRSITGSDPTSEEKSSFWKGNTGEAAPSDQKKDEFWDKQDKK